ncbi:MAG: multicomponent Na+:H+ antiporter subunit E [Arenicella sp.]|jgi:multicomponent Na+:H+ antiporter subunit E
MSRLRVDKESTNSQLAFSFSSMFSLDFLLRIILFSFFWGLLVRFDQGSLGVGVAFILAASLLSLYLAQQQRKTKQWLRSPVSLLSFIVYFAVQSLRGGWEIAKLALSHKLRLSPGFVKYHTNLATESQVFTFMQILSLLPGTVSARQHGRELTIHVMNMETFDAAEIDDCQMRIKKLLGNPVHPLADRKKL